MSTNFSTIFLLVRHFKTFSTRRLSTIVQSNPTDPFPLDNHRQNSWQKRVNGKIRHVEPELVGITEFVGQHRKLTAVVKRSAADFQVREIDLDKKIVQLTTLRPPQEKELIKDEPCYTHCTLFKENVSWTDVIRYLSEKLKISPNDISGAGMKDKRAKTSQRISILNVDPRRLVQISKMSWGIKLGDFSYGSSEITRGDLTGNNFRILLRNVSSTNSSIDSPSSVSVDFERAAQSLRELGFINYFGLQRFGHVGTHLVGKAMLQLNWEKVFDIILRPKENDPKNMVQAKAIWFSKRDPLECVKLCPAPNTSNYNSVEACLFRGLAENYNGGAGDLVAAFLAIPKAFASIYYSSIKSFLWNHLATFRLKKFGFKPVPGDAVSVDGVVGTCFQLNDGPHSAATAAADGASIKQEISTGDAQKIKILTEQDFVNGDCQKYSIFDVLLPVPGSLMTNYPNEMVQEYYEKLLRDNDLNLDSFARFVDLVYKDNPTRLNSYRQLVLKPIDFDYKIISYSNEHELDTFIPSDWDLVDPTRTEKLSDQPPLWPNMAKGNLLEKNKICAYLQFSLPRSSYATMAFREILSNYNF